MKNLIILFVLSSLMASINAQSFKDENCNCKEVKVVEYDSKLPESSVIVKVNDIHLDRKINSLSELTDKELKKIKKTARKFKSCKVFVDFNQQIIDKSLNPWVTEKHIFYLVVRELK